MSGIMLADGREPDDHLHTPDPVRDRKVDKGGSILTCRGFVNIGFVLVLGLGILMLLYVARGFCTASPPTHSSTFAALGIR